MTVKHAWTSCRSDSSSRLHSHTELSDYNSQATLADSILVSVHDSMCCYCFVRWNTDLDPHSLPHGTHMSSLLSMSEHSL